MIDFDLANMIRDRIATDIHVEGMGENRLVIYMPFVFDDGDQFSIFATKDSDNRWLLSDEGDVWKRVSELGFDPTKESNVERLGKLAGFYGVTDDDGSLVIRTADESLVRSLFTLTQTCLEASWLVKTPKAAKRSEREDFSARLNKIILTAIPDADVEYNWHSPEHDPNGLYAADVRIPGRDKQLLLFGVPNQPSCMRATISCQHYRLAGLDFDGVAIYDHEEDLPRRYTQQLNEVVDHHFPRIGEHRTIEQFLKSKAA